MALIALIGFLIGLLIGLRARVFALVPLEIIGLLAACVGSVFFGFGLAMESFALASLTLQIGYVLAAVFQRTRPVRFVMQTSESRP